MDVPIMTNDRKLEIGEINPEDFETAQDSDYPHGIYVCGCKKFFHGHWNRTYHYGICPNREEGETNGK
jgi:hypothetical protein